MNSLMPAARASSMVYWMSGRSTNGRISFGTDLVAGRNRVPSPATGNTAFVTVLVIRILAFHPVINERLPTRRARRSSDRTCEAL